MSSVPLLELRGISLRLGDRALLRGLDLVLQAGRHGLIGPNGAGKTSLLHVCMGLVRPDSGRVLLWGEEVRDDKDWRRLRRAVGFLFQDADDQLFSPTVIEDVAFGLLNHGAGPDMARQRALAMLARLGLDGLGDRLTHHLSGGEQKLVALATILVMDPHLLLLDEPTNNLDPRTRDRLIGILRELPQSYLIVSHDWDFLARTTNLLHGLDHGHLHALETSHLHVHHHAHPYGDHPHQHEE